VAPRHKPLAGPCSPREPLPWRVGAWLWHGECGGLARGGAKGKGRHTVTGKKGRDRGEEAQSVIGRINELTSPAEQCTEVRSNATVEKAEICSEAARHAAVEGSSRTIRSHRNLISGGAPQEHTSATYSAHAPRGSDQECQVQSSDASAAWLLITSDELLQRQGARQNEREDRTSGPKIPNCS